MNKKIVFFLTSLLSLASCANSDEIYMTSVDGLWKKNEAKKIDFEVRDATSPKNLIFVIRNNNDYPYSNLFLISTIKGEKNKVIKIDTLQYILAQPNGEWLGSGMGDVKELLVQYKNTYKFPSQGKYQIEIKHGMRTNELKGIEDLGVKIENIKTTP